jgi:NADH-quinone oxidoreductase subunit L
VALPWLAHGFSSFVYHGEPHHAEPEYFLMLISTLVSVGGIGLAWLIYHRKTVSADAIASKFKPLYTLLYNKYYFDELYDLIIVRPVIAIGKFLWDFDANFVDGAVNGAGRLTVLWSDIKQWFDVHIVDGAVNGTGWLVRQGAAWGRHLQTGAVQFYALFIVGILVVFGMFRVELLSESGVPHGLLTAAIIVLSIMLGYVSRNIWKRPRPDVALESEEQSVRVEDK